VNAVVVFMKYPETGKVKTRLGEAVGMEKAAKLYRMCITETLTLVRNSGVEMRFAAVTPAEKTRAFTDEILPAGFEAFAQAGGDLGQRMYLAFRHVFARGAARVVIIGSDSPSLPVSYIDEALDALVLHDAVFGPASDGGYYLIGFRSMPSSEIFQGIEWSTGRVLQQTLGRANTSGCGFHLLPEWYDVDDSASLKRAVADAPDGRIAGFVNSDPELLASL
jgi:rSAM/selenodomain-associated transferase 1